MAEVDPLDLIVADGRIKSRPTHYCGMPEVLTVDLELLAATLCTWLELIYSTSDALYNRYQGSYTEATAAIQGDIRALVDFLIGVTYNNLRNVLERYHPTQVAARMKTRCPIPNNLEFPEWLSATLSSIGPCRVNDGPRDRLIVYASSAATMNTYGRKAAVDFSSGYYYRFLDVLRGIRVRLAPFPTMAQEGSFFPTLVPEIKDYGWTIYGTVHDSHYENEDIAKIALTTNEHGITPFEDIGVTIGYVDDTAAVTALTAVAASAGIPAGQNATSAGRPVIGSNIRVNYYGLQPAVPIQGDVPEQPAGFYVLGRGTEKYYQTIRASSIATPEIFRILLNRLFRTDFVVEAVEERLLEDDSSVS